MSVLRGQGPPDLTELVKVLGAAMLEAGGVENPHERIDQAMRSGAGLDKFRAMIQAQGGNGDLAPEHLPSAAHARRVRADGDGYVCGVEAGQIGMAAMRLGAGRRTIDDTIDHAVGITLSAKIGTAVSRGDVLATLRFNDPGSVDRAAEQVAAAFRLAPEPPPPRPLIMEEVSSEHG